VSLPYVTLKRINLQVREGLSRMQFRLDRRPSKWGATAAVTQATTVEAVLAFLEGSQGHPFDDVTPVSEVTEIKGYRFCLLQVSLDFTHPRFNQIAELLDEMGGSEFQVIAVETPEQSVYLIIDKNNLPEEEVKPDHPMLNRLADWLGSALHQIAK